MMGSTPKAILISALLLRILTLALLAASIAVMATNKFTNALDGSKATFKDIVTYRYVVATGVIGFVYVLIQIPMALFMACKQKASRNKFFLNFAFFGDKIITFLLATGAAAGFALTTEFKRSLKELINENTSEVLIFLAAEEPDQKAFNNRSTISCGLLFLAAISMAFVSIFSSIDKTWQTNVGFFTR